MLLRRALRTLGRAARRVATLLARGVAPTGGGTGSPALFALFGKKGRPGGNPKNQSRVGGAAPSAPTPALAVGQRETGGRFPRGQVWRSTPSRGFRGICSLASLSPLFHVPLDCVPALPSRTTRGLRAAPGPRSALTGCGRSAEPDSCFLEVAGGWCGGGSAPYPRALRSMKPSAAVPRVQSAGALTRGQEPVSCFLVSGSAADCAA